MNYYERRTGLSNLTREASNITLVFEVGGSGAPSKVPWGGGVGEIDHT